MAIKANTPAMKKNGHPIELMVDSGNAFQPNVDIVDTLDRLILYVDLPGVEANGSKVEIDENNILSLHAKNSFAEPSGEMIRQVRIGDYYRAFQLGPEYDRERISAELKNGVLILSIPKRAESKPKRIEIQA